MTRRTDKEIADEVNSALSLKDKNRLKAIAMYKKGLTPSEIAVILHVTIRSVDGYITETRREMKYAKQSDPNEQASVLEDKKKCAKILADTAQITNPLTSTMPDEYKRMVQLSAQAKLINPEWKPSDTIAYFEKEKKFMLEKAKEHPKPIIYHRPTKFHQKQHTIVDAICNPKVKAIFAGGCQRAGKSTAVLAGFHELSLQSEKALRIDMMAGKGGTSDKDGGAKRILRDLKVDPILEFQNQQMLDWENCTSDTITWKGGTQLVAHPTKVTFKGSDCDVAWVDELDVALKEKEKREAVMSLANAMRVSPNFKLILTGNPDKGIYKILEEEFAKLALSSESVVFIDIHKEDCPHLQTQDVGENDEILSTFGSVLVGDSLIKSRLGGGTSSEGDTFDFPSIEEAFATYDYVFANARTQLRFLAVDPSQTGHPWGWFLGSYDPMKDEMYEFESGQMEMGDPKVDPSKCSPQHIKEFLLDKAQKNGIKTFVCEGNCGGAELVLFMKQHGFRAYTQVWSGNNKINSHDSFIRLLRHFLDERKIYLCNPKLKQQLTIYNPKKDKEQHKGDIADALLHFVWVAVSGLTYLRKLAQRQSQAPKMAFGA